MSDLPPVSAEPPQGETPLDRALRLAGGDAADGRAVDALLNAELCLLLDGPAGEDSFSPRLLGLEAGRTALAFDEEARLAAFGGGEDYVRLPGRMLVGMLASEGLCLAVNPGVAPSELFHAAEALRWMSEISAARAETAETRLSDLAPPRAASEALIGALDAKIAAFAPMLAEAWLLEARGEEMDAPRLILALRERPSATPEIGKALEAAAEARRRAVALAASESVRLAAPEAPALDALFLDEGAPLLSAARRLGLGFELPEPEAPRMAEIDGGGVEGSGAEGPGMDPTKPPRLR